MMSVSVPSGITRYHCESFPPPNLRKVVYALIAEQRARGAIRGQNAARGTASGASREYTERGPADDLIRFLVNERVLKLINGSKQEMEIDTVRAELVIEACRRKCRSADVEVSDWQPPSQPLIADADDFDAIVDAQEEIIPLSSTSQAWLATMMPYAAMLDVSSPARYVLYLTPIEEDIWASLVSVAEMIDGETRVPIPQNDVELHAKWASQRIRCTTSEYRQTLIRFIQAGILEPTGNADHSHVAYRFPKPVEAFYAVPIKRRAIVVVPSAQIELSAWIQDCFRAKAEEGRIPHSDIVRAMYRRLDRAPDASWVCEESYPWIFGAPAHDDGDPERGIFLPIAQGPECLMAYPGFFPFTFVLEGREPSHAASVFVVTDASGDERVVLLDADEMGLADPTTPSTLYMPDGSLRPPLPTAGMLADVSDEDLVGRRQLVDRLQSYLAEYASVLQTEDGRRVAERERQRQLNAERERIAAEIAERERARIALRAQYDAADAEEQRVIAELAARCKQLV